MEQLIILQHAASLIQTAFSRALWPYHTSPFSGFGFQMVFQIVSSRRVALLSLHVTQVGSEAFMSSWSEGLLRAYI